MAKKSTFFFLLSLAFVSLTSLNLLNHEPTKALNNFQSNHQINVNNPRDNLITDLPENPYEIGDYYNARAYFKCSVGNTNHNQQCPGGIVRRGNGDTSVVVLFPNNYEVQYDFKNNDVTTTYDGHLSWGKSGDEWYIGIDNELFIIIPDAAVYGG